MLFLCIIPASTTWSNVGNLCFTADEIDRKTRINARFMYRINDRLRIRLSSSKPSTKQAIEWNNLILKKKIMSKTNWWIIRYENIYVNNITILTYQAMVWQEIVATTYQLHRIHKNQERKITEQDSGMHRSIWLPFRTDCKKIFAIN